LYSVGFTNFHGLPDVKWAPCGPIQFWRPALIRLL